MRRSTLPALLILGACTQGKVQTDPLAFGAARSAAWLTWSQTNVDSTATWHRFVLSDHPGLCKELEQVVPAMADAYATFVDASLQFISDPAQQCVAEQAYHAALADHTEDLFAKELNLVSLTLRDPKAGPESTPPTGQLVHGFDEAQPYWTGELTGFRANPYRTVADLANCEPDWETAANQAAEADWDAWQTERGELTSETKGEEVFKLDLEADLVDAMGAAAGVLEASGRFQHCTLAFEGQLPLYF